MRPLFKEVETVNALYLAIECYIRATNKLNWRKQAARVPQAL
jgi:hypothetical protein